MAAIDIKRLTLDELAGVLTLYPWYAAARKELCVRMVRTGDWGTAQYADAAMYMPSRRVISDLVRSVGTRDYSDKDISRILREYIDKAAPSKAADGQGEARSSVRVVGGDFFSKSEYEAVSREEDRIFSSFALNARGEASEDSADADGELFCTETMAAIYAEQGYYERAEKIYSRLSLLYPEKSAYFASLIEKIKN